MDREVMGNIIIEDSELEIKTLKAVLEMAETSVVSVLVENENSMDSNNLDKGTVD
jgi:hypothetical protein